MLAIANNESCHFKFHHHNESPSGGALAIRDTKVTRGQSDESSFPLNDHVDPRKYVNYGT